MPFRKRSFALTTRAGRAGGPGQPPLLRASPTRIVPAFAPPPARAQPARMEQMASCLLLLMKFCFSASSASSLVLLRVPAWLSPCVFHWISYMSSPSGLCATLAAMANAREGISIYLYIYLISLHRLRGPCGRTGRSAPFTRHPARMTASPPLPGLLGLQCSLLPISLLTQFAATHA